MLQFSIFLKQDKKIATTRVSGNFEPRPTAWEQSGNLIFGGGQNGA